MLLVSSIIDIHGEQDALKDASKVMETIVSISTRELEEIQLELTKFYVKNDTKVKLIGTFILSFLQ